MTSYLLRREQTLPSDTATLYHSDVATYQYPAVTYPYVADTRPPTPPPPGPPQPDVKPPQRPRRWAKVLGIGAAATAVLAGAVFGGFAVGRSNPKIVTTPAPTVTAMPAAQPFDATDIAWCAEFVRADDAIIDQGRANGWPRNVAGREVPASAWTPEERAENAKFLQYIGTFGNESVRDLAARSHNPVLTALMDAQLSAVDSITRVLESGTYQPTDYRNLLTISGTGTAIRDICTEIEKD